MASNIIKPGNKSNKSAKIPAIQGEKKSGNDSGRNYREAKNRLPVPDEQKKTGVQAITHRPPIILTNTIIL